MSLPRFIFLDTSSVERKNFDFSSDLFTSLAEACQQHHVQLLLPAGIESEIRRHMANRVTDALKSIRAGIKKASFLRKRDHWSKMPYRDHFLKKETENLFDTFLARFTLRRLGFDTADLVEVMSWYDAETGPFSGGKKKNEFPDAFAISSLLSFAHDNRCEIAVVSHDGDFERACKEHSALLYFSSIAALTEALLGQEQRIEELRKLLFENEDVISVAVAESFEEGTFNLADDSNADVADIEAFEVNDLEISIIAIGENEFTVEFGATVKFSATVTCDDPDTVFRDPDTKDLVSYHQLSGTVYEDTEVYGTAKLLIVDGAIELGLFELAPDVVELSTIPYGGDWDD